MRIDNIRSFADKMTSNDPDFQIVTATNEAGEDTSYMRLSFQAQLRMNVAKNSHIMFDLTDDNRVWIGLNPVPAIRNEDGELSKEAKQGATINGGAIQNRSVVEFLSGLMEDVNQFSLGEVREEYESTVGQTVKFFHLKPILQRKEQIAPELVNEVQE